MFTPRMEGETVEDQSEFSHRGKGVGNCLDAALDLRVADPLSALNLGREAETDCHRPIGRAVSSSE